MAAKCDLCGTSDFSVPGKAFLMAIRCPRCQIILCVSCAGREPVQNEIEALVCPKCRWHGIESVPEVA